MATRFLPVWRRQYADVALGALSERRLGWVANAAAGTLAVPISAAVRRPMLGPVQCHLAITYRCNNVCFMCDLPKPRLYKTRGDREYDTEEMKSLLDDLAALGVAGVGFTGGEPTLRDDCFRLARHGRSRGMHMHLNTNAYRLHEPERVGELLDSGIASINVSLDGARASTHDRLRGAPGGFERVARATELIRAGRRGRTPTLTYTFVVGPENHQEIPAFVELARSRQVDSVTFIPLHGCYEGARPIDAETRAGMARSVQWLLEARAGAHSGFIDTSDSYLTLFPRSFAGEPSPLSCYAGYQNILVDCYGNVYGCAFHFENRYAVGNLREVSLRELWNGDAYARRRDEMSRCRACYWNCHTESNLLYQRAPGISTAG